MLAGFALLLGATGSPADAMVLIVINVRPIPVINTNPLDFLGFIIYHSLSLVPGPQFS